ncbi:MAG: zinc ribbon domain-containing protein [Desulfobacteraceae bacterium]
MPIYEFQCNKCGKPFEQLVFPSDTEETFVCPFCGHHDVCRLLSSFSCGTSSSESGLPSSACAPKGGFS